MLHIACTALHSCTIFWVRIHRTSSGDEFCWPHATFSQRNTSVVHATVVSVVSAITSKQPRHKQCVCFLQTSPCLALGSAMSFFTHIVLGLHYTRHVHTNCCLKHAFMNEVLYATVMMLLIFGSAMSFFTHIVLNLHCTLHVLNVF